VEDWQALADALNARMTDQGLMQRELAEQSGVSVSTIRQIQAAVPRRRSPVTLAALARALDWPDDHLRQILRPRPQGSSPGASNESALDTRLDNVEERVRELIERVNRLETPQGGR
jgi:transcriptional regulator with XRE-family HTH domain